MHFDEPEGEKKIQRFSPCDGERIRLANVSHAENWRIWADLDLEEEMQRDGGMAKINIHLAITRSTDLFVSHFQAIQTHRWSSFVMNK